jgi:competence protein ComEC
MLAVGAANFWMDDAPVVEALRLRRVPMMAAALSFAAGDILARRWQETFFLAAASLLVLLLAIGSMRAAQRVAVVPVLALWVVVGCWCAQIQPPIAPQHQLAQYADGLSRTVRGRVVRVRMLRTLTQNGSDSETSQQPWQAEPGAWETESRSISTCRRWKK